MNGRIQAHTAILFANILFALNYSYSKSLIPGFLAPEALCIARIGCAALVFALIAIVIVRERIRWRDLGWLALAALFGTGGNQYIFLQGLQYTSPVDAAIISVIGPVLVLVISALLGRDRITWLKSIGIAIGASGALLTILYGGIANFGSGHLTGNILVFAAALSYASYLIVVKNLMMRYHPITVTAWMFGLSPLAPLDRRDRVGRPDPGRVGQPRFRHPGSHRHRLSLRGRQPEKTQTHHGQHLHLPATRHRLVRRDSSGPGQDRLGQNHGCIAGLRGSIHRHPILPFRRQKNCE